jgi:hypothetical protein
LAARLAARRFAAAAGQLLRLVLLVVVGVQELRVAFLRTVLAPPPRRRQFLVLASFVVLFLLVAVVDGWLLVDLLGLFCHCCRRRRKIATGTFGPGRFRVCGSHGRGSG